MKEYFNNKRQKAGALHDDMIFRKHVRGSKHTFMAMDAWGIDFSIVQELLKDGCKEIRIKDEETGVVYRISIDDFCARAVERNYTGRQLLVPKKYFETYDHKKGETREN